MRSGKRKKRRGDNLVHYALHKKDRQAWGAPTMCGKKKVSMTFDRAKVTCTKCMIHTDWTAAQVKRACSDPLFFCPACDAGELKILAHSPQAYYLTCTNCDHKERRTW